MKAIKYIGIALFVLILLLIGFAKLERISPLGMVEPTTLNTGMFSDVVINGYDVVAYHTEQKAIQGNEAYFSNWNDGKWLFSSASNKKLFDAKPDLYAPLFGGYCVFAVSQGFTANTDPEVFEIIDGQLIFFAAEDVHQEWMKDSVTNLKICTQKWSQ